MPTLDRHDRPFGAPLYVKEFGDGTPTEVIDGRIAEMIRYLIDYGPRILGMRRGHARLDFGEGASTVVLGLHEALDKRTVQKDASPAPAS
jgi:hypothetical protein